MTHRSTPSNQYAERQSASRMHEHAWEVESRHRTSLGEVLYVKCVACDVRRVDLRESGDLPPSALSNTTTSHR